MDSRVTLHPGRMAAWRRRRRRVVSPERPTPVVAVSPGAVLVASAWCGLLAGLAELGLTIAQKHLRDPSPGFFRMNRHIVWTIPTFNLALFTLVGLLLAVCVRVRPRRSVRLAAGVLGVLTILTLLLSLGKLHAWACILLSSGIAYRVSARAESHIPAFGKLVRWTLPVLALGVIGLVSLSLGRDVLREHRAMAMSPPTPLVGRDAPNVLLVVLDTVRADRLSLYGYGRETSPNLERLARRGVTFEQARSTASWTLPSHASMMTGRWPHQHSARLHGPLDGTHATLAQYLASRGYDTAGFVANTTYCGAETGLDRGFVHYEDHDLSAGGILRTSALGRRVVWESLVWASDRLGGDLLAEPRKDAVRIGRDLLAWTEHRRDRPFFAFLNFMDAHSPYIPPAGFDRHFGIKPASRADLKTLDKWFTLDKETLPARDHRLASDAYDDCIAYLDGQLGRLFAELERRKLLANTLVLITADHGESFGEHNLFCHASSLYDPEIHVPLIALLPDGAQAGRTVAEPVSLRDLAATVADLSGLGAASPFPGRSLARHWNPSTSGESDPSLAEVDGPAKSTPNLGRSPAFRGPMKALVSGRDVYIRSGEGVEEVYDLATDPSQTRNLVGSTALLPRLEALRGDLDRMTRDDTRPMEWRSTVSTRRQLGRVIGPAKVTR